MIVHFYGHEKLPPLVPYETDYDVMKVNLN
jgi:hypothetical protein